MSDNPDLENMTAEQLKSEVVRLRNLLSEEPKITHMEYTPESGLEFDPKRDD